jgi:hypothetical protein
MYYALTSADGRVAIMQLSEGANIATEVANFAAVNWPVIGISEIDPATIPTDRTNRNDWTVDGGKIVIKTAGL